MTSIPGIQTKQFQANNLPGLPAVLLYQIPQLTKPDLDIETLLLQNPALLMRVIEHKELFRYSGAAKKCAELVRNLDPVWLAGLLQNLALHQCLLPEATNSTIRARLWYQQRLQTLLATLLARQLGYLHPGAVALAATLSGIGLLVQQTRHGEAWEHLCADTRSQTELMQAERTLFGADHVEVATGILEQLHMDSSLIDGTRY